MTKEQVITTIKEAAERHGLPSATKRQPFARADHLWHLWKPIYAKRTWAVKPLAMQDLSQARKGGLSIAVYLGD